MSSGIELKNWHDLRAAVRQLADAVDAVENGSNEYGTFYRVEGMLEGPTASCVTWLLCPLGVRSS